MKMIKLGKKIINKRFSFLSIITLILFVGILSGCNKVSGGDKAGKDSESGDILKLVAATINPNDALLTKALIAFSEEIEIQSEGRITVDVHGGGTLGNASSLYQSVINGDIDMIYSDTGWFAEHHPEFDILSTNYLFEDQEDFETIVNTDGKFSYFEDLLIEKPGLKTVMFAGGLERNMISTFPIESVTDLKGQSIRSGGSASELEWWASLGANPTTVDFNEVYSAIQTNVVHGSQNSLDAMIEQRFGEVAKYVARTQHNLTLGFVVMNNERYESLSNENKAAIEKAKEKVQTEYIKKAFEVAEEDITILEDEFGVTFTNPDKTGFIEASRKQTQTLAEEFGITDIVAEIFD